MAEVDTSIYKNVGAGNQPMTPAQVMQMIGGINQIRLQNQEINARNGIAAAYNGNPSPNLSTLARGAGYMAPSVVGQAQNNITTQLANEKAQQTYLRSTLGSLASLPNPSMRDVNNWAVTVARNTNAPPQMIQQIVDGASTFANDPKALKKYIATQGIISMGTGALAGETGAPTAAGQPMSITAGEGILNRAGVGPGSIGANPQAETGMPTAMAPGFEHAAQASGALMGAARARAAHFGADIYPLEQSLGALERLGPTGTGPGTDELNTIKSFLQSNLNWLPGVKIDPNSIKDFDEAKKYLTQAAGSRAAAFGHGTDQALSTALTANPNTHISNLAAVDLTKATIALRRMEQAQTLQADRIGVQPGQFATWAARWATNVDPRAFMVDLLDQKQLQNLQKTLKNPKERARFNSSVQMAIDNGIITRPGGEHAPGQ